MGDRLNVDWNVESPPAGAEMPLLILQPLLENAIYHGIQPLPEGGTITVKIRFDADLMEARIQNPLSTLENSGGSGGPGSPVCLTKEIIWPLQTFASDCRHFMAAKLR
jgi:two-component system sensor histidine kinase AlgZ